jgi:hypothetical protein
VKQMKGSCNQQMKARPIAGGHKNPRGERGRAARYVMS